MNFPRIGVVFFWACLLVASCSRTGTVPNQAPNDLGQQIIGPWLRAIPGSHEFDGYHFAPGGSLQLLNIFSMQPDDWSLTETRLSITTHTERYPEPQATIYTIDFISEDTLHLGLNGGQTIYHRPKYTTELTNTRWVPQFFPKATPELTSETELFLQLSSTNTLKGFAGCNHFSSAYSTKMSQLTVSPILTTKMYCPNMQYENNFLGALSGSNNYLVVEDQLYLFKEKVLQGAFKAMYYQ